MASTRLVASYEDGCCAKTGSPRKTPLRRIWAKTRWARARRNIVGSCCRLDLRSEGIIRFLARKAKSKVCWVSRGRRVKHSPAFLAGTCAHLVQNKWSPNTVVATPQTRPEEHTSELQSR